MSAQARLGLLVLAGIVFFIAALVIVAQRSFLLSDTFQVSAEFGNVGGLLPGAGVNYRGLSVGRVERLTPPASPGAPIEVTMEVLDKYRHLIRRDTRAVIATDGIVGDVIVTLSGGSDSQPEIAEGGTLRGVDPLDFTQVSDRLFDSVSRFDSVTVGLTQMMADVRTGQGTIGRFLYDDALYNEFLLTGQETRVALGELGAGADALVGIAAEASGGMNEIIRRVYTGEGTLARILNEDDAYETLLGATTTLEQASQTLSGISTDVSVLTDRFEDAANWATLGAFRFAENMEALKHNFLFRSYYQDRGYLEMAPFEVRERALAESYDDLEEQLRQIDEIRRQLEAREAALQGREPEPARTTPDPVPAGGGEPAPIPGGGEPEASEPETEEPEPAAPEGPAPAVDADTTATEG